jgi:heme/copper-type cytochrome/quinol oxidase subunit 4
VCHARAGGDNGSCGNTVVHVLGTPFAVAVAVTAIPLAVAIKTAATKTATQGIINAMLYK